MVGHLTPVCVQDYEALAQAKLSDQVWAYSVGGAADEITVRENRSAWDTLRPLPGGMRPLGGGPDVADAAAAGPGGAAEIGARAGRRSHCDGRRGTRHGLVLSAMSSVLLEVVAAQVLDEPTRGALWFHIYLQPDRGATQALALRAR